MLARAGTRDNHRFVHDVVAMRTVLMIVPEHWVLCGCIFFS